MEMMWVVRRSMNEQCASLEELHRWAAETCGLCRALRGMDKEERSLNARSVGGYNAQSRARGIIACGDNMEPAPLSLVED